MNRFFISFFLGALFTYGSLSAQITEVGTSDSSPVTVSSGGGSFAFDGGHLRLKNIDKSVPKETIKILKKKYLTFSYELVTIDDSDVQGHLRYNIYEDEMEFIRENSLYYLAKEKGRKVHFDDLKATYKLLSYADKLQYFKVLVNGNYSLLAKHRVRYFEARSAESGYDTAKPAKYKRLKDELYLALGYGKIVKLSGMKKNDFLAVFSNRSTEISTFMKSNKLSHKRSEGLKKIVGYYNTL